VIRACRFQCPLLAKADISKLSSDVRFWHKADIALARVWYDSLMDGVHDMGGMDGFGKIEVEKNEPVFHAEWEGRVLAMQRAMSYAGAWRIDHSRFAKEQLPPITYLSASYYQRWVLGMEKNIIERGFATAEELKAGHASTAGKMLRRKLTVSVLQDALARPSYFRQQQAPALFKPGDRVRTRNIHPKTHTRLPGYARGKLGVVERCQGCHVYPDSVAVDQGDNPQWLCKQFPVWQTLGDISRIST